MRKLRRQRRRQATELARLLVALDAAAQRGRLTPRRQYLRATVGR